LATVYRSRFKFLYEFHIYSFAVGVGGLSGHALVVPRRRAGWQSL